jgi:hypothetical protein
VGIASQRERERGGVLGLGDRRGARPGVAHAGRRGKGEMGCQGRGPAQEGGGGRAGRASGLGCLLFFLLLSFFFSILKLFKQNLFEFK